MRKRPGSGREAGGELAERRDVDRVALLFEVREQPFVRVGSDQVRVGADAVKAVHHPRAVRLGLLGERDQRFGRAGRESRGDVEQVRPGSYGAGGHPACGREALLNQRNVAFLRLADPRDAAGVGKGVRRLLSQHREHRDVLVELGRHARLIVVFVRVAGLEMHPLDGVSRTKLLKDELGVGYCNITKCCSEVCPEDIHITDNAIIPLKERVVDDYYDPVRWFLRKLRGKD